MSAHILLQQQAGRLHGRQMTMLVTVALHALVIAGLMAMRVMPDLKIPDLIAAIDPPTVDQTPEPPPPATVVDRNLPQTTIQLSFVDRLDPEIPPEQSTAPANLSQPDPGPATVAASDGPGTNSIPQMPSTPLQYRAVRSADDYYPSQSLSLQEQGMAIVRLCVTPSGKLDGKPVIETSSGSPRLDAAALAWAREALHFTPATQGGVPIGACKGFRVNFTLH